MVDPILVLKNTKKVSDIPKIEFDESDHVGIDVISLKMYDGNTPIQSPGMIRLRNRSHKPIRLNPILFSYESSDSERGHLAILSSTKYGYSNAETLKNLSYKQKVSEDYKVRENYNVLENYRDEFITIENKLKELYGNQSLVGLAKYDIILQPSEVSHFMIYYGEYDKSNEKQKVIAQHLEKISREEEMREKAYKKGKKSDSG